jgi:hypothetical protein
MIQEAKQQYRGVLCVHCRQPIPLPTTGSRRAAAPEAENSGQRHDPGPPVFTLRCRVCQEEGLYTESKFIDCEGTPRMRPSRSRKASPLPKDQGNLSRAATNG